MEAENSSINYQEQYESLLKEKNQMEADFGQKRAQFRQLYIDCEAQLKNEKEVTRQLQIQVEDFTKKIDDFKSENEGIRTAARFSEEAKQEELTALQAKHQEEIASLQHIWQEASKENQARLVNEFEESRKKMLEANKKLEQRLRNDVRPSEDSSKTASGEGLMSMMTNAFSSKRNSTSQLPQVRGIDNPAAGVSLEGDQQMVQEDVKAWKSVVGPLEQENLNLKRQISDLQKKLVGLQRKHVQAQNVAEHNKAEELHTSSVESSEKIKEVQKYLEAERSARTDLEMYVAVLNTQKGVLQEDADALRRELHNVCRLYEQEKMNHSELKQTWKLANEKFLAQQSNLICENDKMKKMLTNQQLELLAREVRQERENATHITSSTPTEPKTQPDPELKTKPEPKTTRNDLMSFEDPNAGHKHPKIDNLVETFKKKLTPTMQRKHLENASKSRPSQKITESIFNSLFPAASQARHFNQMIQNESRTNEKPLVLSSSSESEDDDDDLEAAIIQQNQNKYCHVEEAEEVDETSSSNLPSSTLMKKSNSIDNIVKPVSRGQSQLHEKSLSQGDVSWNSSITKSQSYNDEVDSKLSLNETGWSVTSDDYAHHQCMMCQNYEKQLQRHQKELDALKHKESTLSVLANDTQYQLAAEKEKFQSLEKSVETVAGDQKSQLNIYETNQVEVDKQVDLLRKQFLQFQQNIVKEMKSLAEDRDRTVAQYTTLQLEVEDRMSQPSTGLNTDVDVLKCQFEKLKTESQTTEESLKGEIMFLKDRAIAEQFDRETTENVLQQDLNQARQELLRLKHKLVSPTESSDQEKHS